MEKTINIPNHGNQNPLIDKDHQISNNEELVEFLCHFVSSHKISQLPADSKKNLSENMGLIKSLHKNKFQEVLKIMKCQVCKINELNIITACNHGFCTGCITSHISNKTLGKIILNELESRDPLFLSTFCPFCNEFLTEVDLKLIYDNLEELKLAAKMRKIQEDMKKLKYFECCNCKKIRGTSQFMNATCGHMCKTCFAQRGCEQLDGSCEVCLAPIDEKSCGNETVLCRKCNGAFYPIGDFVQEICTNQLFCPNCAFDIVEKGVCYCHNSPVPYEKKLEVVRSSYRICFKCNDEKVIGCFIRHKCCKVSICFDCADKSDICINCQVPYSLRIKKSIADFFNRS